MCLFGVRKEGIRRDCAYASMRALRRMEGDSMVSQTWDGWTRERSSRRQVKVARMNTSR